MRAGQFFDSFDLASRSAPTPSNDTTPDAFSFAAKTGVAVNTPVESDAITVSGINAPAAISVQNGEYQINNGSWTRSNGTVNNGDRVKVRHTSSSQYSATVTTTLTIGGVQGEFRSTTQAAAACTITLSAESQTVVAGSGTGSVSVTASANSCAWQASSNAPWLKLTGTGGAGNGTLNFTFDANPDTTPRTGTLTIGGKTFTVTQAAAPAVDTTPDAFQFDAKTNVALASEVLSNAITVSGINAPAAISVQNGEYRINGGAWRSQPSTVRDGDKVEVLHTAADKPNREIITTVTIGGVSAEFRSTTAAQAANQAPIARFTASLSAPHVPLTVTLDASPSTDPDGSIASYHWRLSDGRTAQGVRVSFDFTEPGPVSATLTVTDQHGARGELTLGGELPADPTPPAQQAADGTGYIDGTVVNACNNHPIRYVDVSFSRPGFSRLQQTNRDGRYEIELPSGVYTTRVSYASFDSDQRIIDLQPRETRIGNFLLQPRGGCGQIQPAETRKAILIAGSGPKLLHQSNRIWESTQALADRAYTALLLKGFRRQDIFYLTADPTLTPRDADKDGNNDINGFASLENLERALTQWGGGVEQMIVYFVGHGGTGHLQLNREQLLTSQQLKAWLDVLQGKLLTDRRGEPGKLSVILDACKSGSFIAPLAAKNRYVITSTAADLDAVISNRDGSTSFSYHFWGQIGFKNGWLSTAFEQARQAMSSVLVGPAKTQRAVLDADGSGGDTSEEDYKILGSYCYGNCNTMASVLPVIEAVSPTEQLAGQLSAVLKVRANKPLQAAWVTMQRPDYHFPTDGSAVTSMLEIPLDCAGGNSCEGRYDNFNLNDDYQVTFYVRDFDGNLGVPYTLRLFQSGLAQGGEKRNAKAIFEDTTGILTLKDVAVGEQRYYVELQDRGGLQFTPQHLQLLSEATTTTPARFDGQRVTVPSVFAYGAYYAVDLIPANGLFQVDLNSVRPAGP